MGYDKPYDVVGIGVGPANLSLAALLDPIRGVHALFLEARDDFAWHPGLLMPGSTLQSSYLKDLVSLVDPCSAFSFFNFLVKNRRIYRFLVSKFATVSRHEYEAYYRWVARSLPSVRFSSPVRTVRCEDGIFHIDAGGVTVKSRHIVVGSGAEPHIPSHLRSLPASIAFHAAQFLDRARDLAGKTVAVIGGGQTGAEITHHLLSESITGPKQVLWISRRPNFVPLDESPFANEYFTPKYADYFRTLPPHTRRALLDQQRFASDGISESLLERIYQRLYELDFIEGGRRRYELLPGRGLTHVETDSEGLRLELLSEHATEQRRADIIVFCTGYATGIPRYLDAFESLIVRDEARAPIVRSDFSIRWDGEATNRIFVHGMARSTRGVAEPNLGLMSWRSAKIINSLCQRTVYDIDTVPGPVSWPAPDGRATSDTRGKFEIAAHPAGVNGEPLFECDRERHAY